MATNFLPFRPTGIRACATSNHQRYDSDRQKTSSSSWWTPLFGWSSEPDYIDSDNNSTREKIDPDGKAETTRSNPNLGRSNRFSPGCFTEEKARQLRLMTKETKPFHDMYHSAIASRLATEFNDRSENR